MCPLLGFCPATQACALTGNQTSDILIHRPALSLLSHTSQGIQGNFILFYLFFKDFIYLLLKRGEGRESNINELEIHQSVASLTPPVRDLTYNPSMCPAWELNWQPWFADF